MVDKCPICYNDITNYGESGYSGFTDDPLKTPTHFITSLRGAVMIRAPHITELRDKINYYESQLGAVSGYSGLSGYALTTWTDIQADKFEARPQYINELRIAIEGVLNTLGVLLADWLSYDENGVPTLGISGWLDGNRLTKNQIVRGMHIEELRKAIPTDVIIFVFESYNGYWFYEWYAFLAPYKEGDTDLIVTRLENSNFLLPKPIWGGGTYSSLCTDGAYIYGVAPVIISPTPPETYNYILCKWSLNGALINSRIIYTGLEMLPYPRTIVGDTSLYLLISMGYYGLNYILKINKDTLVEEASEATTITWHGVTSDFALDDLKIDKTYLYTFSLGPENYAGGAHASPWFDSGYPIVTFVYMWMNSTMVEIRDKNTLVLSDTFYSNNAEEIIYPGASGSFTFYKPLISPNDVMRNGNMGIDSLGNFYYWERQMRVDYYWTGVPPHVWEDFHYSVTNIQDNYMKHTWKNTRTILRTRSIPSPDYYEDTAITLGNTYAYSNQFNGNSGYSGELIVRKIDDQVLKLDLTQLTFNSTVYIINQIGKIFSSYECRFSKP